MRFTNASIEALKPRAKRYEVTETYVTPDRRGLQAFINPSGTKAFVHRYKKAGLTRRVRLGHFPAMSVEEAHNKLSDVKRLIEAGWDPRPVSNGAPDDKESVAFLAYEFMEKYVKQHRKPSSIEYARRILEKDILPRWGDRKARSIKPREVIELLDDIVDRKAPVMANRTASLLSQMFKYGIHRALLEDSPCKLLFPPGGREKPRERVLSDNEIRLLWQKLSDQSSEVSDEHAGNMRSPGIKLALKLLLVTGQRRGEIAKARWIDFDFDDAIWRIPAEHSKNGQPHDVPLSDLALELLGSMKKMAGSSPWVLPSDQTRGSIRPEAITRAVSRNRDYFGIDAFCTHDLRRSAASGMAALGVPQIIIGKVLNHTDPSITATYNRHDYSSEKQDALQGWSNHVRSATAIYPPTSEVDSRFTL